MKWLKKALGMQGRDKATQLVTEGFVHAHEGRLDEARRSYEAAVDADETFAVAWLNLGLCRLDLFNRDAVALDDEDRARALDRIAEALGKALHLDDDSAAGWRALARVEERRFAWARAEDAWQKAEAHAPKESLAAVEAAKARRAIAKKAAADRARLRALKALATDVDAGERTAAFAALTPFLDENATIPGEEPVVVTRGFGLAGTLARRLGDRAAARAWLEKAWAADRDDVDALRELASVCIEDGDLPRALQTSMEAYRARPTDAGLVCNVGVCHLGLGNVGEAAEFIEIAHKLDPKDPIVLRAKDALAKARAGKA